MLERTFFRSFLNSSINNYEENVNKMSYKFNRNVILILYNNIDIRKMKGDYIMEEKFGTLIIDGKVVDLDKAPVEELEKMKDKLKKQMVETKKQINTTLEELER